MSRPPPCVTPVTPKTRRIRDENNNSDGPRILDRDEAARNNKPESEENDLHREQQQATVSFFDDPPVFRPATLLLACLLQVRLLARQSRQQRCELKPAAAQSSVGGQGSSSERLQRKWLQRGRGVSGQQQAQTVKQSSPAGI